MASSEDENTKEEGPKPIAIKPHDAVVFTEADVADIWTASPFAPAWFEDAIRESKAGLGDYNARRREILFAITFAESYLVEWVRDDVFKGNFQNFHDYYLRKTALFQLRVKEKFQRIPKELCNDGIILRCPTWENNRHWKEFTKLVKYRNGIVHASSSRPESGSMSPGERPLPPASLLTQLQPGWAIGVVVELVKELHQVLGTPLPAWLNL